MLRVVKKVPPCRARSGLCCVGRRLTFFQGSSLRHAGSSVKKRDIRGARVPRDPYALNSLLPDGLWHAVLRAAKQGCEPCMLLKGLPCMPHSAPPPSSSLRSSPTGPPGERSNAVRRAPYAARQRAVLAAKRNAKKTPLHQASGFGMGARSCGFASCALLVTSRSSW